ncbi:MAG: hypothetical protein E7596_07710 [Ruminococcaceae bacterium]|nr:hypothetical protein [Oscillospiraceae bacterium]
MKKLLYLALCIVLLLGMISCFVACGDDEEEPAPTPSGTDNSTGSSKPSTESSGNNSGNSGSSGSSGNTDTSTGGSGTTDSGKDDPGSEDSGNGGSGSTDEEKPPEHTHTFASEYSYDEINHYYAATCEHTNEKAGTEPHAHDVYTGECKCGHKVTNLFENAINVILANRGSVTSGSSIYKYSFVEMNTQTTITTGYKFYEDYLYVRDLSDYTNEYYYAVDSKDNSMFSVIVQSSTGNSTAVVLNKDASVDNLKGAEFNLSCIEEGDTIVYGAEELVNYFYQLALAEGTQDLVTEIKDGVFAISFVTCAVGDQADLYNIGVGFGIDKETNTLSAVSIMIDKYDSEKYELVDNKYVLVENVQPLYKYNYTIKQSTEEIEYVENPYDPDKAKVDSLVVKNDKGENIEDITYYLPDGGGKVELFLSDVTPSTAMLGLCEKDIRIVDKATGEEITKPYTYFDPTKNSLLFSLNIPGSYTMTIIVDGNEYTTDVEVALRKPNMISSQVYNSSISEFENYSVTTVYCGSPLYFKSLVPQYCDGSYKATFIGDVDEAVATIVDGEINGNAVSVFTANQVGTYKIKIESTVMENKSCIFTVNVVEAPSVDNILCGTYMGVDADGQSTVNLTFDTENSTIEVDLTEYGFTTKEVISYTYKDGKLTYEYVSGDNFVTSFYMTEGFELVIVVYDDYTFLLESTTEVIETVATGTFVLEGGELAGTYKFELYSNDVFAFYKGEELTTEFSLVIKDGAYMFKLKDGAEQKLIKLEGTAGELDGKYKTESSSVNITITEDVPEPVVLEGTLHLTDRATGNTENSYTGDYAFICTDGVFTFYKDGEVCKDISLTVNNGIYTLKFPSVASGCTLVKTKGEDDSIEGTYDAQMGIGLSIGTVEISLKVEEEPKPDEYTAKKGVNHIAINNAELGAIVTFTAQTAGKYRFLPMYGEDNLVMCRLTETGKESLALPYEIELKANESIVFMVYTVNNQSDVVGIVIEEIENKPPVVELPDDEL